MIDMDHLIPAMVIVIGNVCSGNPGSKRWEVVTALFGITSLISIVLFVLPFTRTSPAIPSWVPEGLIATAGFCMLQALTRDWERSLKLAIGRWSGK